MAKHVAEVVEPEALPWVEERRSSTVVRAVTWVLMVPLMVLGVIALTGTVLHFTGHLRVATVISGSMEPGIPTGSLVLGWAAEPEVDDVVMATRHDGALVTHRVIELLPAGEFRMQGDANPSPDAQTYDGESWTVFLYLPEVGRAFRWVLETPLAMAGVGVLAGLVLAGVFRPDCRECRAVREWFMNS